MSLQLYLNSNLLLLLSVIGVMREERMEASYRKAPASKLWRDIKEKRGIGLALRDEKTMVLGHSSEALMVTPG